LGVQHEEITALACSPRALNTFATITRTNQLVQIWDAATGLCVKQWRAAGHKSPVQCMVYEQTGTLLATGSRSDGGLVQVWDTEGGYATHSFRPGGSSVLGSRAGAEAEACTRGVGGGVVTALAFVPHPHAVQRLAVGYDDGKLRLFDLVTSAEIASLQEHLSSVTAFAFAPSGNVMVSAARDKVLCVWDLRDVDKAVAMVQADSSADGVTAYKRLLAAAHKSTVPVSENVETALTLPEGLFAAPKAVAQGATASAFYFVTGGDGGLLRLWRLQTELSAAAAGSRSGSAAPAQGAARMMTYSCQCVGGRTLSAIRSPAAASASAAPEQDGATLRPTNVDGDASANQFEILALRPMPLPAGSAAPAPAEPKAVEASGSKRKRAPEAPAASAPVPSSYQLLLATKDQVISLLALSPAEQGARSELLRPSLRPLRSFVGHADEVMDICYVPRTPVDMLQACSPNPEEKGADESLFHPLHAGSRPSLLAVATTNELVRLVEAETLSSRLLHGHRDSVLCVAASPEGTLVATGSKDRAARVWDVATGSCVAILEGHTDPVTTIAFPSKAANFPRKHPFSKAVLGSAAAGWVVTGSKDRTVKMWQLGPLLTQLPSPRPAEWSASSVDAVLASVASSSAEKADGTTSKKGKAVAPAAATAADGAAFRGRALAAVVAHDKDVNSVAVAPNDKLIATGGQDKVVKVWAVLPASVSGVSLTLLSTLRGHKRGVWCVAFSPADQVLASASGDKTIRLWSMAGAGAAAAGGPTPAFACLRTLQGHEASVLTCRYIRGGRQVLSGGADGLIKLWDVRAEGQGECLSTFDEDSGDSAPGHGKDEGDEDVGSGAKVWSIAVRPADLRNGDGKKASRKGARGDDDMEDEDDDEDEQEQESAPTVLYEGEMATGGGGGGLTLWQDMTAEETAGEMAAAEDAMLKQQELFNAMAQRNYTRAVVLTLELNQPGRCGDILQEMLEKGLTPPTANLGPAELDQRFAKQMLDELNEMGRLGSRYDASVIASTAPETAAKKDKKSEPAAPAPAAAKPGLGSAEGEARLCAILSTLSPLHLGRLLLYTREWNTQSRHGLLAQHLLYLALKTFTRARLAEALAAVRGQDALLFSSGKGAGGGGLDGLRLIPGVGTSMLPSAAFLSGDNAHSTREAAHTAALSELRSTVTALLPYSERHQDRLDRLGQSAHLVDFALATVEGAAAVAVDLDVLIDSLGNAAQARHEELMGLTGTGKATAALARKRAAESMGMQASADGMDEDDF
jgi:WD40 repeat protein